MPGQTQVRKGRSRRSNKIRDWPQASSAKADTKEALKADLADVLDEIDAVLEENAEEFVGNYVQHGGQ